MKVTYDGESPYGQLICNYFNAQFPRLAKVDDRNLLELLTGIIVGTKDLRFGTLPSPETLVNVRKVIADAIRRGLPIPALVPWGGRKAWAGAKLDIAEVSALRQLVRVDQAVRDLYPQGMQYSVRVEDTGALWLYRDQPSARGEIMDYTLAMRGLGEIVTPGTRLKMFVESDAMPEQKYFALSAELSELIESYLHFSDAHPNANPEDSGAFKTLMLYGWQGTIPREQRDYYRSRYASLYPGIDNLTATRMLADYFGGAKARKDMRGVGDPDSEVQGNIKITFAHPVPNAPAGMFDNTLYYRTIPMSQARTHIAPWRGKGYLKISGNDVTPKITHWRDRDTLSQLESATHRIENGIYAVTIQTDYLIES